MRCLGIDYGERRIGLAYGDELGVAVALAAAVQPTVDERMAAIGAVISARRIDQLVVGYPYNMDGSAGFKAREVDAFIAELERRFQLPVARVDERLTSHLAESAWRQTARRGHRLRDIRDSGRIDSQAAAIILQDYLDQQPGAPLLSDDLPLDHPDDA
jgi:putative holliday junction resolvase